jgi:hypothetical protein
VLTIGNKADGETSALLIDGESVQPISLREPRRKASALSLPTGQVAVVGGTRISDGAPAQSLEFFTSR